MAVGQLTHIGLCVSELDRAVRFYRDVIGFREVGRLEVTDARAGILLQMESVKLHAVYLERDGVRLELLYYAWPGHVGRPDPRPMNLLGLTHLSFQVDDLAAAIEKLRSAGARVLEDTRIGSPPAIFVADPDGTRLELVQAPRRPSAGASS
jgi:catechol 2,3-dioxygenase-like lactoylglutathione lyase family enzyme